MRSGKNLPYIHRTTFGLLRSHHGAVATSKIRVNAIREIKKQVCLCTVWVLQYAF